jgi:hypothetical protein
MLREERGEGAKEAEDGVFGCCCFGAVSILLGSESVKDVL